MDLKHAISLKSIQNARELGGYITADGRRIKNGVLLRTASLSLISDDDICMLTDTYHLQHIIDFRMEAELPGAEDPVIDGVKHHHLDVIDMAASGLEEYARSGISKPDVMQIVRLSVESRLMNENMYIGFLANDGGKKAFSEFFRILLKAAPDRSVLWHCTSGKDRTGLAAMLLLSVLGVEEDVIMEDYLLTNEYYAEQIEGMKLLLQSKGCDDACIDQAILVFDAVDERFMQNAIHYLKKEYGSVIGYIHNALLISQEDIHILKAKYLEPLF